MFRRVLILACLFGTIDAFAPSSSLPLRKSRAATASHPSILCSASSSSSHETSRRSMLGMAFGLALNTVISTSPVHAESGNKAVMHIKTADGISGDVEITFLPDVAPQTVEQFKRWVSEGVYDGTAFHRVNEFSGKKVLVGGDPYTKEDKWCTTIKEKQSCSSGNGYGPDGVISNGKKSSNDDDKATRNLWDKGGPDGWRRDSLSAIKLEPEFNGSHKAGAISMRRFGAPNSAGSQFIICLNDMTAELDGQAAVFGQVTGGIDVLKRMSGKDVLKSASPLEFPRDDGKMAATWSAWDRPAYRQGITSIELK